jgi:uncharacterized damage-inducible protein DinB
MSVFSNPASRSLEDARAYTAAVLALLGDRPPLDVLESTTRELTTRLEALSARQLSTPEAPGKWSIRQILRHLADSEIVWGWRLRLVLAQERPPITGYDQDRWAVRLQYEDADPGQALAEFAAVRTGNLWLVHRATDTDLLRVGVHAERGEESVAHMMRMYAGHDVLHLRQIDRITATIER